MYAKLAISCFAGKMTLGVALVHEVSDEPMVLCVVCGQEALTERSVNELIPEVQTSYHSGTQPHAMACTMAA